MGLSVWRETSKKLTVYRVCYTPFETLLKPAMFLFKTAILHFKHAAIYDKTLEHCGCLPFNRKNRLIKYCSKWEASKPRMEISMGCACSTSTDIFTGMDKCLKAWK